jgi:hypothetical protein
MMDFTAIAAATVEILIPYFKKVAEKAAETLGKRSLDLTARLYEFLHSNLSRDPAASAALQKLSEAPGNREFQTAMQSELARAMESDPKLAELLRQFTSMPSAEGTLSSALSATVIGDNNKVAQQGGSGNTINIK